MSATRGGAARRANMARILRTPIPAEYLSAIAGDAPSEVKAMAVKWLNVYHAPGPTGCFAGASTRRTVVRKVSLVEDDDENARAGGLDGGVGKKLRLVLVSEVDIADELLDARDRLSNSFVFAIIDECVSSAVATLDFALGGQGMTGVSLSINTTWHNAVSPGGRLRFVSTTMGVDGGIASCRCEVWDDTQHQLVATGVFSGMIASPSPQMSSVEGCKRLASLRIAFRLLSKGCRQSSFASSNTTLSDASSNSYAATVSFSPGPSRSCQTCRIGQSRPSAAADISQPPTSLRLSSSSSLTPQRVRNAKTASPCVDNAPRPHSLALTPLLGHVHSIHVTDTHRHDTPGASRYIHRSFPPNTQSPNYTMDAYIHPGASKRRQYASDQTQAYTGATVDSLTQAVDSLSFPALPGPEDPNANLQPQPQPQSRRDIDLMTYPPNPADLALPPPAIVVPEGTMHLVERDDAPFYQQPSIGAVPKNDTILHQTKLPFGFIVSPHRTLKADEAAVPVVEDGIIARCQRCLAYINPYVQLLDYNTRWRCSLCGTHNAVPPEFGFSHVPRDAEYRSRAELTHTVVDFAATTDYIRNPPQAPAFVFLLDAFEMLVVPDLQEPYLPCTHDDLLVNLSDSELRTRFDELFGRLPELFDGTNTGMSRECATGPALDAARVLLAEGGGGKIVLISASAPNVGRGALDSPNQDQIEQHTVDKSAASFYHDLAIACVKGCVTVDLFLVGYGRRYVGLSTLSLLPYYTGGLTMYYPSLSLSLSPTTPTTTPTTPPTKFPTELARVLSLPILLEAELRIRCSRGISVKSMNGDFFLQGTDRAVLASMPPDGGYAVELQIDGTLADTPVIVIQTALLHTTSTGQRGIRVVNSALPVVQTAGEVFDSADARVVVAMYAQQRSRAVVRSPEEQQEKLLYKTVEDICAAYAAVASVHAGASSLQMRLPEAMKMLPVLMLGLYKRIAAQVQPHNEQALDVSAYTRTILTAANLHRLIGFVYPAVYSLHNMPSDVGVPSENSEIRLPQALPLTSSWWEPHGLYLIDAGDGQSVFLWVGRRAVAQLVQDVFGPGTGSYDELRSGKVDLPELDTPVSRVARTLIAAIRDPSGGSAVRYPDVIVVKDEPGPDRWREEVIQMLVQDRLDDLRPSYRQFLVKVHERMR
uniref:Protein transport protein SEC24 n=1 Tax=Mycena chlorophos TaxID=658473 RepID=A0ABQ0LHW2_MYCCL|nr:predicted protein [Mycena chlorophos]